MILPFGLLRFHQGAITGDFRILLLDRPVVSPSLEALWLFSSSLLGTGLAALLFVGAVRAFACEDGHCKCFASGQLRASFWASGGASFYLSWLSPASRGGLAQVRGDIDTMGSLWGWMIGLRHGYRGLGHHQQIALAQRLSVGMERYLPQPNASHVGG